MLIFKQHPTTTTKSNNNIPSINLFAEWGKVVYKYFFFISIAWIGGTCAAPVTQSIHPSIYPFVPCFRCVSEGVLFVRSWLKVECACKWTRSYTWLVNSRKDECSWIPFENQLEFFCFSISVKMDAVWTNQLSLAFHATILYCEEIYHFGWRHIWIKEISFYNLGQWFCCCSCSKSFFFVCLFESRIDCKITL